MRKYPSSPSPSRFLWVAWLLLFPAAAGYGQNTRAFIVPQGTPPYILGDIILFNIEVDTRGELITGLEFFLTLDPAIFKPVFTDGRPFIAGSWLGGDTYNDMHGDSLHLSPDFNGILGWQLDYYQHTFSLETRTGRGMGASFKVEVVGLPNDPIVIPTICFERDHVHQRETGYFRYIPGGVGSSKKGFANYPATVQIELAGMAISPAIPDTIVTPGSGIDLYLGDYFYSNVVDSSAAVWTWQLVSPASLPSGASLTIAPPGPSPSSRLVLTTSAANHFILDAIIEVAGTDTSTGQPFDDQQDLRVIVDHAPVFDRPLPDTLTTNEDVPITYFPANGTLFTDRDDTGPDITIWLEPDSLVHLNYDSATDTVTFYADTNWFGSYPARLFVEDALGLSADTLLTFTVNPVNDPPVVNFDSASALGDTLVIHRNVPDTLDLKLFVTDVDDPVLNWSISNPDPTNLTDTLLTGNRLKLLAADDAAYVDIDLVLTATDDSSASGSDTLVVSIRSWPPEIGPLPDIRILAGTPDTLSLDELVSDNDTPDSAMTWSFEVVDFVTGITDDSVSYAYDSLTQTVIFNTDSGYAATDLLRLTVEDDDHNTDTDSTRLKVFPSLSPFIFPLDTVIVYRDTSTQVLDLDDYVLDPIFSPDTLSWSHFGGDSLKDVRIDEIDHILTIETYPDFFGYDSISLIATNPVAYSDTAVLVVRVIPRYDGPPVWQPLQDAVQNVYPYIDTLFILTDVCKDDFTPGDQLVFTGFVNPDPLKPLNLNIDPTTLVASISVSQPDTFTTWLYFSAEDGLGQVSPSDTITVCVKDSCSPVWQRIPTITLNVGETYSGLFLQDYVSDRDTPDNLLVIDIVNLNSLITVSYDSVTTELTVRAGSKTSDSRLIITATDDKGNTATVLAHVVVNAVADYTPPAGGLTYFFNPATSRWIHYVVVADSTTDIHRFRWHYSYGTPPRDYSNFLAFAMKDSLPGTLTWIAPYHFRDEGTYHLSVVITDANNNMLEPIPSLALSVGLSKAMGDVLTSPDQQLTVSYPPVPIPAGKLLIISEESLPESAGAPRGARWRRYAEAGYAQGMETAEIVGAVGNNEDGGQVPATVYSLDTNLPEPILVTLTYHQNREADPYYSFYEVDGDRLLKVETYASTDGQFEAAVMLGKDIVFASSNTPARKAPLPDGELFCYPNPFNATIQVRFMLRWEDRGRIVIYNLLGREVYASPREPFGAGVHAFSWHGIDSRGLLVPSGAYFIRLETEGGKVLTRKVTLLK